MAKIKSIIPTTGIYAIYSSGANFYKVKLHGFALIENMFGDDVFAPIDNLTLAGDNFLGENPAANFEGYYYTENSTLIDKSILTDENFHECTKRHSHLQFEKD